LGHCQCHIDRPDNIALLKGNFQKFQAAINAERARRVVADLAVCVARVEAGQVGKMLALPEGSAEAKKYQGHDVLTCVKEPVLEKFEGETAIVLKLHENLRP
jgi:hypothetical protein